MGSSSSKVQTVDPRSAAFSHPEGDLPLLYRGVSLRWLLRSLREQRSTCCFFWDRWREGSWLNSTSDELVADMIRPATSDRQCSYAEWLPRKHVGKADYFISYSWGVPLYNIVETIIRAIDPLAGMFDHDSLQRDYFVWIDIFAVTQWPGEVQQSALSHLSDVIRECENGTLVIYGTEGVPLTRIWCLYEIWQTTLQRGNAGLKLCIPEITGSMAICKLSFAQFEQMDLVAAKSTVADDKQRILSAIRESRKSDVEVVMSIREALAASAISDTVTRLFPSSGKYATYSMGKSHFTRLRWCFDLHLLLEDMRDAVKLQQQPAANLRLSYKVLSMHSDEARMAHPHFAAVRAHIIASVESALQALSSGPAFRVKSLREGWKRMQLQLRLLNPTTDFKEERSDSLIQQRP